MKATVTWNPQYPETVFIELPCGAATAAVAAPGPIGSVIVAMLGFHSQCSEGHCCFDEPGDKSVDNVDNSN